MVNILAWKASWEPVKKMTNRIKKDLESSKVHEHHEGPMSKERAKEPFYILKEPWTIGEQQHDLRESKNPLKNHQERRAQGRKQGPYTVDHETEGILWRNRKDHEP